MSRPPFLQSLRWSGRTHPGRVRQNNEDAFLALVLNPREVRYLGKDGSAGFEEGDFVFAVSDGMGGANAGEFASKIAVEKISRILPNHFREQGPRVRHQSEEVLRRVFEEIHREMRSMGFHYEECRGMGATLSLSWISPDRIVFAHVGDSRIYHLPSGEGRIQLTEDDTYVGRLFRRGEINEREAHNHPQRNVLDMSLGAERETISCQTGFLQPTAGDTLVLTSDGVQDGVFDRNLENLVRNPPSYYAGLNPAERLVKEALSASGRDNITALVVELA